MTEVVLDGVDPNGAGFYSLVHSDTSSTTFLWQGGQTEGVEALPK